MVICKLGEKGCWNDGKCRLKPCSCENQVVTNADRIRAMTDEELAKDFCRILVRTMEELGVEPTGSLEDAVRVRLKWLQAPAEGE